MRNFSLSENEVLEMKAFYQQEMANLRKRLDHVQSIIGKLDTGGSEVKAPAPTAPATRTASAPATGSSASAATTEQAPAPQKRRRRKRTTATAATTAAPATTSKPKEAKNEGRRGRKSKWGTYILKTLEKENEPMPANELVDRARTRYNVPEKDETKLKAAIAGSLYRLQHVNDQIQPYNAEGIRGNVYGLKDWFKGDNLKEEYQNNLRKKLTEKATEEYLAAKASSGDSRAKKAGRPAKAEAAPKKRGRGRPPKSASPAVQAKPTATTGKRRGRKRKTETAPAPAPAATSVKPKGRRGRKPRAKS
ncbi:MAG: hypothetical protein WD077_11765 [Bacteroidia bacterium]